MHASFDLKWTLLKYKKTVFPLNIEAVVNKRKTVLIFIKIVYLTLNIYKIMVLRLSMLRVNM